MDKGTNARPSTHGPDGATPGRRSNGQFAKGNRLGQGNPMAGRAAKLRSALLRSVSEADVKAITKSLVQAARDGDVAAVKLLLAYTVGQPEAADVSQRLDELENRLNLRGSL
jgi:hypothetical protein